MIVLDTHVWIWWLDDNPCLRSDARNRIDNESDLKISAISLLEIATACALGRLVLRPSADEWLKVAQLAERLTVEPLTASLCLESTRLPDSFHRDPADRLIVALARRLDCDLATADGKILAYPHVKTLDARA